MAAPDDPRDVVLQAERAVSSAIFSSGGGEAVLLATAAAREGKRAAAVLAPDELLGAIGALHAAARARAPIVVHVVAGPAAPAPAAAAPDMGSLCPGSTTGLRVAEPGSPAYPGRDELAPALDAGAGVLVAWSAQESIDLTLAARRAAEDAETPFVLVTDGGGPVMALPGQGLVARFLGEGGPQPAREATHPAAGKRLERSFAARAPFALAGAMRTLGELTGRPLGPVERYETTDAEEIVVAVGQAFTAARAAAEGLRREGRRVGAVGVRVLRPVFPAELVKAVARARAVAVVEPLDVALAPAGPLASTLKAAFADALTWAPGFPGVGRIPPIVSVVFATLGAGGAVTEAEIREALAELPAGDRARRLIVFGSEVA